LEETRGKKRGGWEMEKEKKGEKEKEKKGEENNFKKGIQTGSNLP
jgi:hypothetical protein